MSKPEEAQIEKLKEVGNPFEGRGILFMFGLTSTIGIIGMLAAHFAGY